MKILFLSLLDFSTIEETGIYADLMREFVKEGHEVYIISPTEKRKNQETYLIESNNVEILKIQIGNIQKTNIIEKGISTITLERKLISGIKKYFDSVKFDLILYSTPPITFQKVVEFVKKRDKTKTYLLLKDIFPQNAVDIGILNKKGPIYKYFREKEKRLYNISDYIGCMSKGNVKYLLEKNPYISSGKVEICPNSIEPRIIKVSEDEKRQIRSKYNIPSEKVVFIYGGNLGKPQGIDFLIKCLIENENNDKSFILIVGSGTEDYKLKELFENGKLRNSKFIEQIPKKDYEILANTCDVGLIFLDNRFTIPNFPSRILSYMQASIPVLAATDENTDIGEIIQKGNFGYWCKSGDLENFNFYLNELCETELRFRLGQNSRSYLENNYTSSHSYEIIMKHFN